MQEVVGSSYYLGITISKDLERTKKHEQRNLQSQEDNGFIKKSSDCTKEFNDLQVYI